MMHIFTAVNLRAGNVALQFHRDASIYSVVNMIGAYVGCCFETFIKVVSCVLFHCVSIITSAN